MDTPVRLLVVDPDAATLSSVSILAEEEGIDVRTAVDVSGAIRQCRLEYLDLVMINTRADGAAGAHLLQTIRMQRPTVRAVFTDGRHIPIRQMLRKLRDEPRHVPDGFSEPLGGAEDPVWRPSEVCPRPQPARGATHLLT